MPETSMFTPTEATRKPPAHHKKPAHHAHGEGAVRAEESRKRMISKFDQRTTGMLADKLADKKRLADEKLKREMAGLKGKLAGRKVERAKKSKEVSGGVDTKKNNEANLDRIFEAYEEANTVNDFMRFMLKNSDLMLTKERAESDPSIKQHLESKFDEEKTGLRYEDLVQALPSEEDYENNAHGQEVEEAEKTKKINAGASMRDLRKKLKKHAEDKEPSKDTKEAMASLKNLPPTEVEENLNFIKNMKEAGVGNLEEIPEVKEEVSPIPNEAEKLKSARISVEAAAESPIKKKKPELSPAAIEAIKRSAEEDEAKFVSESQRFVPRKEDREKAEIQNQMAAENKQWHEEKLGLLSKSLVQAYKEMGVKITKDNEEEFLIKKPPFSYIFSAKGRKVRDLYARYIKELK